MPSRQPSPRPSLQETLRNRAIESFPGTYTGSEHAAWIIASSQPLNTTTQHALYSSAQALGVNPNDLAYVVLDYAATDCALTNCSVMDKQLPMNKQEMSEQESSDKQEHANEQAPTDDQEPSKQDSHDAPHTASSLKANKTTDPLLVLIEALDPLAVVLSDYASVVCASHAYNKPLALHAKEHLLGRPCVCFENLEALMKHPKDKQRAWNCLKTLRI